jgi:hypothetical protein
MQHRMGTFVEGGCGRGRMVALQVGDSLVHPLVVAAEMSVLLDVLVEREVVGVNVDQYIVSPRVACEPLSLVPAPSSMRSVGSAANHSSKARRRRLPARRPTAAQRPGAAPRPRAFRPGDGAQRRDQPAVRTRPPAVVRRPCRCLPCDRSLPSMGSSMAPAPFSSRRRSCRVGHGRRDIG